MTFAFLPHEIPLSVPKKHTQLAEFFLPRISDDMQRFCQQEGQSLAKQNQTKGKARPKTSCD